MKPTETNGTIYIDPVTETLYRAMVTGTASGALYYLVYRGEWDENKSVDSLPSRAIKIWPRTE
jgi:hypothetical protein